MKRISSQHCTKIIMLVAQCSRFPTNYHQRLKQEIYQFVWVSIFPIHPNPVLSLYSSVLFLFSLFVFIKLYDSYLIPIFLIYLSSYTRAVDVFLVLKCGFSVYFGLYALFSIARISIAFLMIGAISCSFEFSFSIVSLILCFSFSLIYFFRFLVEWIGERSRIRKLQQ